VTLDHHPVGRTKWIGEIAVGRHELTLQTEDGQRLTRALDVVEDHSVQLCWDFYVGAPCPRQ
jgi:hypothetical protein